MEAGEGAKVVTLSQGNRIPFSPWKGGITKKEPLRCKCTGQEKLESLNFLYRKKCTFAARCKSGFGLEKSSRAKVLASDLHHPVNNPSCILRHTIRPVFAGRFLCFNSSNAVLHLFFCPSFDSNSQFHFSNTRTQIFHNHHFFKSTLISISNLNGLY